MISKVAALGLLLLPAARAPGSLITDGDFVDGGPAVSDGTGWAKVDISDCPCAATGGKFFLRCCPVRSQTLRCTPTTCW